MFLRKVVNYMAKKNTARKQDTQYNPMILVGVLVGILVAFGWLMYVNRLTGMYGSSSQVRMMGNY